MDALENIKDDIQDTMSYTAAQLYYFASEMCLNHRALNNPSDDEDNIINEWRTGQIKLLSTVVTPEKLLKYCFKNSSVEGCWAKNCPAWSLNNATGE